MPAKPVPTMATWWWGVVTSAVSSLRSERPASPSWIVVEAAPLRFAASLGIRILRGRRGGLGRQDGGVEQGPLGPLHLVGEDQLDAAPGDRLQGVDELGQRSRALAGQVAEADPVGELGHQVGGQAAKAALQQRAQGGGGAEV